MAMILMIIIFTFVGQTTALYRILIKIVLLPLIAGLALSLIHIFITSRGSSIAKGGVIYQCLHSSHEIFLSAVIKQADHIGDIIFCIIGISDT